MATHFLSGEFGSITARLHPQSMPPSDNNRFLNSSFHRDLSGEKPTGSQSMTSGPSLKKAPVARAGSSPFIRGLIDTANPSWKLAPPELRRRYRGIYLILVSVPIILVLLYELYRRLEGKSVKRVRKGEILEDDDIRLYSETEKWAQEKDSWSYKLFGKDWFLDGFTSKTMKEDPNKK